MDYTHQCLACSGLNQSEYCRQQELNGNTFGAGLSDYRNEQTATLPALIFVQLTRQAMQERQHFFW